MYRNRDGILNGFWIVDDSAYMWCCFERAGINLIARGKEFIDGDLTPRKAFIDFVADGLAQYIKAGGR